MTTDTPTPTEGQPTKRPATDGTVLAVGAAGPYASLVVPELAKRGARVRGLIRDPTKVDAVLAHGAAEVIVGDLREPATVAAALEGVRSVFYIAPAFMPDEAKVGRSMVAAAVAAGVRRIVFSSVIDPVISTLVNHSAKAPVEEAIIESGLEFVLLQPTLFMQTIASSWPTVVKSGVFTEPWSNDTRFSRVDYRDVAEVAAIALTEDRLLYGTYQLCSEGNLDRYALAALMSEVVGRKVQANQASLPPADSTNKQSAEQSPLTKMFEWYDQRGLLGNALTLHAILDREPRTLRAYLEELAAAEPLPATGAA